MRLRLLQDIQLRKRLMHRRISRISSWGAYPIHVGLTMIILRSYRYIVHMQYNVHVGVHMPHILNLMIKHKVNRIRFVAPLYLHVPIFRLFVGAFPCAPLGYTTAFAKRLFLVQRTYKRIHICFVECAIPLKKGFKSSSNNCSDKSMVLFI